MEYNRITKKSGKTLPEVVNSIACLSSVIAAVAIVYVLYSGVQAMNKYIHEPEIQSRNVRGGPEAEQFIERDGKRFYAEIDGKSIETSLKEY